MLVFDRNYIQITTDFGKSVISALLHLKKKERRRRKLWAHPLISQRLLKFQLPKKYEDLGAYPKKYFPFG
jgi:hypothetical protein